MSLNQELLKSAKIIEPIKSNDEAIKIILIINSHSFSGGEIRNAIKFSGKFSIISI